MSRKPVLIYSMASAGMGHVTRAVPLIARLQDEYEIHIFCSGQAHRWIATQFPHVHQNHAIKGVSAGGKISLPLIILKALFELPKSLFFIFRIAIFILIHRPKALITDFEGHSAYAALLTRKLIHVPIICCDHWSALRFSQRPFELDESYLKELERWQKTIKMVSPFADRYLIYSSMKTPLSEAKARYVPTPVRDAFINAGKDPAAQNSTGPVVISLGHLAPASLDEILAGSRQEFVIFGSSNPRKVKNVTYRAFNESDFIKALQNTPFVVVAGYSSAFDTLAVGKPLLYCPSPGQFEQKFCGKIFEYLGVAKLVSELSSREIDEFNGQLEFYKKNISKLVLFDNEKIVSEIRLAIRELQNL